MEIEKLYTTEVTSPEGMSILFKLSMWWRIFYGLLRLFVGIALLRLIGQPLSEFVYTLMAHEITGKTGDAVLEKIYLLFETHDFTVTYFIASYFIFWGIIEIILSFCLLRRVRSAFPITMAFIVVFICYSIFRLTHTHSLILLSVIIIDIGIFYLIKHEYSRITRKRPTANTSTRFDPLHHQT